MQQYKNKGNFSQQSGTSSIFTSCTIHTNTFTYTHISFRQPGAQCYIYIYTYTYTHIIYTSYKHTISHSTHTHYINTPAHMSPAQSSMRETPTEYISDANVQSPSSHTSGAWYPVEDTHTYTHTYTHIYASVQEQSPFSHTCVCVCGVCNWLDALSLPPALSVSLSQFFVPLSDVCTL